MTCLRLRETLSLFVGRDLDETTAADVSAHLAVCHACRNQSERLFRQTDLLQTYGRGNESGTEAPDLWSSVRSRLDVPGSARGGFGLGMGSGGV